MRFYLILSLTAVLLSCATKSPETVTTEAAPPNPDEARQDGVANKFEKIYSQLVTKDLDEMNDLVVNKIKESKKAPEEEGLQRKLEPLKAGLWLVLARPNEDNMVEKILPLLKAPLEELQAWESSFHSLADESIYALKNPKNVSASDQVTYTVVLENIIAEFKPEVKRKSEFETKVIEKIANAKLEITKECRHERKIRMMKSTTSPSVIASQFLKNTKEEESNKAH